MRNTIVSSRNSSARHRDLFDREPVDVIEGLQLLADVRLPAIQIEPRADKPEQPGGVHVADDLERVLGAVCELVDVDEQGMDLTGRANIMPPENPVVPVLHLKIAIDPRQLVVEQVVIVAELQQL